MTVTTAQLADRAGAKKANEADLQATLDVAVELVDDALDGAFRQPGDKVQDEMVLSVGKALWQRRKTSDGASGQQVEVQAGGGNVVAPRDPLASIRPLLAAYVVQV